jgi:phosphatidylserine/phosphatidylglycerophosphate/cardiolipin synthase-like enzyme
LLAQWNEHPKIHGAGIALALEAAGAAADADRAREIRPVWTGPDAGLPVRLTAGVLAELIAGAKHRLTVISFAAYKIPHVLLALEAAARRGVEVDVVLETARDSAGALSFDQLPAFTKLEQVRVWHWPANQRPPEGGSLHAKAIVADGENALITSANLTERALAHNIELGILLRDRYAASEIEAHLDGLRRAGVLIRADH